MQTLNEILNENPGYADGVALSIALNECENPCDDRKSRQYQSDPDGIDAVAIADATVAGDWQSLRKLSQRHADLSWQRAAATAGQLAAMRAEDGKDNADALRQCERSLADRVSFEVVSLRP